MKLFFALLISSALFAGCGGGSSNSAGPAVTVTTTNLSGTLTVPDTLNSDLLASINLVQNTDSIVRKAFASATVLVNDSSTTNFTITPSSLVSDWDIKINAVPQSTNGLYKIDVIAGKIGLKSWVKTAQKDAFTINSKTTAAALIANASGKDATDLIATFPTLISKVTKEIESAFQQARESYTGSSLAAASITTEVTTQSNFLKENLTFDPSAMVGYFGFTNDLDNNDMTDLQIVQNTVGDRIRFLTALSSQVSFMEGIGAIGSYTDSQLLSDFTTGNVSASWTFGAAVSNVALGLYFRKGAVADTYLKLFVKRIDLIDGSFKGVVAEYSFVNATSTAITKGSKTFTIWGQTPTTGTIQATDFLTDTTSSANILTFIDATKGLGSSGDATRLVRAVAGQPDITKVSYAETYSEFGSNYYTNTAAALKAIYLDRSIMVGDVFSAFFPNTRHYALFKITSLSASSVTVDFIVNSTPDEPRF